jgi:hypothetical protein
MMATRLAGQAVLLVCLTSVPSFAGQTQTPPPPPPTSPVPTTPPAPTQSPDDPATPLPVDIERIKRALDSTSPISTDRSKIRFYIETVAKRQTFKDYIGTRDLRYGPVKGSNMTHQDFLDMVTPKLLNSSAGFTATDTLQAALFNWVVQTAVRKGINALKNARSEAEVAAIREQIDRELAALRGRPVK